ncbi:glycosyl transferase [Herbihabitans rhizosphaerae]|uniref:glycosyl transferase n=1 Tax=Herbihabitans rhizosphaerae TaxID=1872711 RepID=UPI001F5E370C|nr:glycosyl transferase [Herbihabitans rhizosphaerae]
MADVAIVACYVVVAFAVVGPLWTDLADGYLTNSGQDQNMWEWFFAVAADGLARGEIPLSTVLQNHPDGVNLMANTSMLGLGIPLAPITWIFGPTVTFALALTGGLAGTAAAWYVVARRHFLTTRAGAAVCGALCGFAPAMISHANAHPNFVGLFVLPFIVSRVITMAHRDRPVRDGVVLGLLVAYQVFLGEEPLLITATGLAVFGACHLAGHGDPLPVLRRLARGLGLAAAVALPLLAYPLWWQFFGPRSYLTLPHGYTGNDVHAFTAFATESVAGDPERAAALSANRTEENAFFGAPLVLLTLAALAWLWRDRTARALGVAALLLAWLSTGILLTVDGTSSAIPGPWMLLAEAPLFDSVLASRFAMACLPMIGLLLGLATDRVLATPRLSLRPLWFAALAVALLPIAPTPLEASERTPVPRFFADGTWRGYVSGGSVVVVPLPDAGNADALHWQTKAGLEVPIAEGYFVGPDGGPERQGTYGAARRPTSSLLHRVSEQGTCPAITPSDQARTRADLRQWRADVVVLGSHQYVDELRSCVDALLGQSARAVGGMWVWDVRGRL